ncbi:MAG: hypothetical protein FD126_699 [Elusimicrobia bacterium]|nr:MAG: hypothetical protein FD126_699 [Elusimicrobiota bacterium]
MLEPLVPQVALRDRAGPQELVEHDVMLEGRVYLCLDGRLVASLEHLERMMALVGQDDRQLGRRSAGDGGEPDFFGRRFIGGEDFGREPGFETKTYPQSLKAGEDFRTPRRGS